MDIVAKPCGRQYRGSIRNCVGSVVVVVAVRRSYRPLDMLISRFRLSNGAAQMLEHLRGQVILRITAVRPRRPC